MRGRVSAFPVVSLLSPCFRVRLTVGCMCLSVGSIVAAPFSVAARRVGRRRSAPLPPRPPLPAPLALPVRAGELEQGGFGLIPRAAGVTYSPRAAGVTYSPLTGESLIAGGCEPLPTPACTPPAPCAPTQPPRAPRGHGHGAAPQGGVAVPLARRVDNPVAGPISRRGSVCTLASDGSTLVVIHEAGAENHHPATASRGPRRSTRSRARRPSRQGGARGCSMLPRNLLLFVLACVTGSSSAMAAVCAGGYGRGTCAGAVLNVTATPVAVVLWNIGVAVWVHYQIGVMVFFSLVG